MSMSVSYCILGWSLDLSLQVEALTLKSVYTLTFFTLSHLHAFNSGMFLNHAFYSSCPACIFNGTAYSLADVSGLM